MSADDKSNGYTSMSFTFLPAGTHEINLRGGKTIVVNALGEVAVRANEGGWGWAIPVTLNDMAPAIMPAHAPDDGRQP